MREKNQSGRQMKRVRVVTLQMAIGDNRTVIPSFRQFNWGRFYWVTSGDSVINKSAKMGEEALLEEELAGKEVVRGTVDVLRVVHETASECYTGKCLMAVSDRNSSTRHFCTGQSVHPTRTL